MEATRRVAGIVALHLDAAFPIAYMEASPTFIVFFFRIFFRYNFFAILLRHHDANWIAANMEANRRVVAILVASIGIILVRRIADIDLTFIVFFSSSESSSETLFAILLIHHDANWIAAKMEATRRVVSLTRVVI